MRIKTESAHDHRMNNGVAVDGASGDGLSDMREDSRVDLSLLIFSCRLSPGRGDLLEGWRLGPPLQSFKVGILIAHGSPTFRLDCLTLSAAFILLPLFHLLRFFTVALSDRCFAWSSDGSLLVPDERVIVAYLAAPRRCGLVGGAASGFGCLGGFFEAERERVSGPNPALARDVT